jgi:uncharacterized damage-inducible protein DinB
MASKGQALAEQFEQTNTELIRTVERLTPAQWQKTCAAEGWTVAATVRHVGGGYGAISGMVQALANGKALPPFSMDDLDKANAQAAKQNANCTKDECLSELRQGGVAAASMLKGLSDEHLARTGTITGGRQMTAEQVAQFILIGHPQEHLQSIRAVS